MKFAIAREHRFFFQKHGRIEFEGLLNQEQLNHFNQAIDQALAARLEVPNEKLHQYSSEQLFLHGRDLWRMSADLRKLVCQPRFAQIVAELVEKKPIRLGYDQLFPPVQQQPDLALKGQIYSEFMLQKVTLEQVSSIQDLLCGLIFCLSSSGENAVENKTEDDIFPSRPGHAIFFRPQLEFDLNRFYAHLDHRFFLIVYASAFSHYQVQAKDPHAHVLKRLGYAINSKLSDRLNPIVYR